MGFLVYLYSPSTISFFVGFHGAKVPFPIFLKYQLHEMTIYNPIESGSKATHFGI
jgi:hypothetical protein